MNYGIEFIKKHISKTPASTRKSQSDAKRRKSDTRTRSAWIKKCDYEDY